MEDDLNKLSSNIITNLDRINRILSTGRLQSKLLSDLKLPDRLLALVQQEWTPTSDVRTVDPSNRLSVEDVDLLFNKIRQRPAGGTASRVNRNLTQKKTVPLQQSRILNETNLANGQSGSLTNLCDSSKLAMKSVDVEALVKSLKQSAEALGRIENRCLEQIDFDRVERFNRRECAKIRDTIQDIEVMVQDLEKFVACEQNTDGERKELLTERLVGLLRDLAETMSQVVFIKNNEYIPDMSKSLVLDSFPLAECLDDVNENIRRNKLYQ
ncbi:uncharacterized protein LOC131696222 [Topomyia yanbarensis]|uniref:uncharacterized protein LOC131695009 n=1 Tax=Topomyia yanbarensis TaxID=2498891 RepID=UPI00273BC3E9|nr:uncharacterized protein LOC131695009 [Topomyia yanbarensis]XP_058840751.1 uncharacterized protein LOC131696222 [Topomyia yanbarensis]